MVGVLLLVAALIAVFAVPGAIGHRAAGSPASEPIAAPPAVGTCVSAITAPAAATPTGLVSGSPARTTLPVATLSSCTGQVVGEVISVTAQGSSTALGSSAHSSSAAQGSAPSAISPGGQDTVPSCRSQVEAYLGTPATTDLLGVQWSRSIYVDAVTVGPDAHDRAAGRTWTACVLSAVDQHYTAPSTLRSSWLSRTLPSAYGLCWADAVVQHGVPTPCTAPHRTQQLAFGLPGGAASEAAMTAQETTGCRQLAAAIMDVRDPTFGGALSVQVVADPAGAPYVQCVVQATDTKRLTGSLVGIGQRALPLS